MVPNSKLCHKFPLVALLIAGCNTIQAPGPRYKCQAVIIVDKTNSVDYTDKLPLLQQELARNFELTYGSATKNIQSSRLIITGITKVFPDLNHFSKDCPDAEEESRSEEEAREKWKMEKRKWMADELKYVISLIKSPCNSNTTDVFSIFSGIQQVQQNNGPWDSINVFIFSDMINTSSPINLLTDITLNNAHEKGKTICQNLIDHGQISSGNTENLYLTIYTPDKMEKPAIVNQFWKGFFQQWGLQDTHYHFE
jgi:hypothetical protein